MINTTISRPDAEPVQRCISELLDQIVVDYQQTKDERRSLATALPEPKEDFTVLEELELAATDLQGYASQVQVHGQITDKATAIAHLKQLRLFDIPSVSTFYFELGETYPQLKDYVSRLDYLRFLLLDFLQ